MENNLDKKQKMLGPNEIEINIKNMIILCVKKLKLIIVIAILGAVIVSGLTYYKDLKNYHYSLNVEETVELTDDDYIAIERYNHLKSKMEQLMDYRENAVLMDIDFNNACQANLQFSVDADESIQKDIVIAIVDYVNSGVLASEIAQEDIFLDKDYIHEIMLVDIYVDEEETKITQQNVFTLEVYAENEKVCSEYVKLISEKIEKYSSHLNSVIGPNKCDLIQGTYTTGYVADVYKVQKEYIAELKTISSEYKEQKNSMSEMQIQTAEKSEDEQENENTIVVTKPKLRVKMIVLGFVVGAIVGAGIVCVLNILNGKIKSEKEIQRRLALNNIGGIKVGTTEIAEQIEYIAVKIGMYMKKYGANKVLMLGTTEYLSSDVFQEILKLLKADNIECEVVGNILTDKDALGKLSEKTNVILVEELEKTKIKDLYKEVEICREINLEVMGYISIV